VTADALDDADDLAPRHDGQLRQRQPVVDDVQAG